MYTYKKNKYKFRKIIPPITGYVIILKYCIVQHIHIDIHILILVHII